MEQVKKKKQSAMDVMFLAQKKVLKKVRTRFFGNMPVTENIKQCLGMFYDTQRRCLTHPQDAEVGFENYLLNFSIIPVDF